MRAEKPSTRQNNQAPEAFPEENSGTDNLLFKDSTPNAEEELMCKYKELELAAAGMKRELTDLESEKIQLEYDARLMHIELTEMATEHERMKMELLSSDQKIQSLRLQNSHLADEVAHYKLLLEKADSHPKKSHKEKDDNAPLSEKPRGKPGWF